MRDKLLDMLDAEENKVIQQLSTAVTSLDKTIDARFDALAEVVDQLVDMVEELQSEDEEEPEEEEEDKPDPLISDILSIVKGLKVSVSNIKTYPQEKLNLAPLQNELSVVKSQISDLRSNQLVFAQSLKKLLTARRIPEFDAEGNVIAVRLEA